MRVFTYEYGSYELEVTAPSEAALGMRDETGDGRCRSFEDGEVIFDFGRRRVIDGHGAVLGYRILRGGQEIYAASGEGIRGHRGGRRISNDPVTYSFRKAV